MVVAGDGLAAIVAGDRVCPRCCSAAPARARRVGKPTQNGTTGAKAEVVAAGWVVGSFLLLLLVDWLIVVIVVAPGGVFGWALVIVGLTEWHQRADESDVILHRATSAAPLRWQRPSTSAAVIATERPITAACRLPPTTNLQPLATRPIIATASFSSTQPPVAYRLPQHAITKTYVQWKPKSNTPHRLRDGPRNELRRCDFDVTVGWLGGWVVGWLALMLICSLIHAAPQLHKPQPPMASGKS